MKKKVKVLRGRKEAVVALQAEAGTMLTTTELLVPLGRPLKLKDVFVRNRELAGQVEKNAGSPWVSEWMRVRGVCFNDGFSVNIDGEHRTSNIQHPRSKGDRAATGKVWLDKGSAGRTARGVLGQLNLDVWSEWLLNDNAVVFWNDGKGLPDPMVLDSEICEYRNDIGGEVLTITPAKRTLSAEEKTAMAAAPGGARWVAAYEKGLPVVVDRKAAEDFGEHFAVLTRAKRGKGFGYPRLRTVYGLLQVLEHLQIGDVSGAHWARDVIRHWTMGFEPRTDELAKIPDLYTMIPARLRALSAAKKNKRGGWEMATNFDVAMKLLYADAKMFDKAKYDGTLGQLDRWGGPAMMLLLLTGQAPAHLLTALGAEGRSERGMVGEFLELLAEDFFGKPVRVAWNPNTFKDHKTMLETLRTGGANGAVSVTTQREWLEVDNEQEVARLKAELKDPEGYRPGFEPKQGMLAGEGGGGRPREVARDLPVE